MALDIAPNAVIVFAVHDDGAPTPSAGTRGRLSHTDAQGFRYYYVRKIGQDVPKILPETVLTNVDNDVKREWWKELANG